MCAATRTGTLDGIGNTDTPAGLGKRQNIFLPTRFVEICGEKPACLVREHGIDADNMASLEMIQDHVGGYRQKGLVGALATSHLGFFAYTANLFIGAGRRVAFLAGLLVLPQLGIDIISASEETKKKGNLVVWREVRILPSPPR